MFDLFLNLCMHLSRPWFFIAVSVSYLPGTLVQLLLTGQFGLLFSLSGIHSAWFARFWSVTGPSMSEMLAPFVRPLMSTASGVVLDVGPGAGEWVRFFDPALLVKVYGIEPNVEQHAALQQRIKEAGLEDIYEILPFGIEDLDKAGLERASIDTIVTIQCLCSIPMPELMIGELYSYLKKGGRWVVYEHVATHKNWAIETYQVLINIIWPIFAGGCSMRRDTDKMLCEAGTWSKISLKQPEIEPVYHTLPHVMGTLTK